ncbi:DUF3027 domain-containing protein [Nocardia cyriacigeorgica]|nr:DUF3027 domain-containing protein [Nocardia cyriacigeorgica]MBF6425903.1 DUF3027 domain-containing protein [Nocardia cyriacigeorgica]BDT84882.1 hypothetical protein FMUAM8_06460 [Nocardia cyriacigeorgica]
MRPILADAVELARRALLELEPSGVGAHLGVSVEDDNAATHRFEATLTGYRGWQWAVVVAAPPGADHPTVSESALLPGPDALIAPEFVPWDQRVRPGDLAPGDLLAPPPNDPRLAPGYTATGDPEIDDVAYQVGLGRSQVLSLEGREEAAQRWYTEFGPDTEMAKAAPGTCGTCGFYLPLAGALRAAFGVCGNAMGADGHVVHTEYGCGAHSDVTVPTGAGSPLYEAYDDAAVDLVPTESLRGAGSDAGAGETASAESASRSAGADGSVDGPADASASNGVAEASGVTDEPGQKQPADSATDRPAQVAEAADQADDAQTTANEGTEVAESGRVEATPAAGAREADTAERVESAETAAADAGAPVGVEVSDAAQTAIAAEPADASGVTSAAEAAEGAPESDTARPADATGGTTAVESAEPDDDAAAVAERADASSGAADQHADAMNTVEPADSVRDRSADAAEASSDEAASNVSRAEQSGASVPESGSSNGTGESGETAEPGDLPATDAQSESGSSALS